MLAQAEQVRLAQLAVELHPAFIPVHLRLAAPGVGLWHEGFQSQQSHRDLSLAHVLAHRRFRHCHFRHLAAQSRPDPVRRVPLLSGRLAVGLQNRLDKWNRRRQFGALPFWNLPLGRHRASQRLTHFSPVHPQLPGYRPDGSAPMFILPPNLFV